MESLLLYHALSMEGVRIYGFWDNDEALDGRTYDGTSITLPVSIDSLGEDVTVIIYSQRHEEDIYKQLNNLGYFNLTPARTMDLGEMQKYHHYFHDEDLCKIIPAEKRLIFERLFYINSKVFSMSNPLRENVDIILGEIGKFTQKSNTRKVLMITHDLSLSGAPIALQSAAKVLIENGDIPIICSSTSGGLLSSLLAENIPVIVDHMFAESKFFIALVSLFDTIILNTFTAQNIFIAKKLNGLSIPVLWWIHEGTYCSYVPNEIIPRYFEENIHFLCVGEYSRSALLRVKQDITAGILLYGMRDFYENRKNTVNDRLVIMTIGALCKRKGQDILCEAIRKLDESLREKCEFIFVGLLNELDKTCKEVMTLKKEFPNNVTLTGEIERDKIREFLHKCDCMVCASRDDPMPIFITEAMMFHKVCICSENTGFNNLIEDGVNGFIFRNNSSDELCRKLEYYIKNHALLDNIRAKSRETYENNFTFEKFNKVLLGEIDFIIDQA
jgi:glycosyltransferase involved in cell wall biosynthesis